ncbi:MAG TPA: ABC transporter permease [Opitutaceae bacterium]|nr:ABC transporter permease [Opitutaceae bacterium]
MHSLLLDLQVALRFFARRRAAFAVIVLTMALALGANTAVFSVVKAFLFSSLGVPQADRVALVWTTKILPGQGRVDFNDAYPNYELLRATTHFWEKIACVQFADVNWEQATDTRRLQGARVTTDFFSLMRVPVVLGRIFTAAEQGPNAAPVAVISHALWRSEFGGAPDVLGRTIRLNGAPHTIVGVLAPVFSQPQGTDVWLPFDLPQELWTARNGARQLFIYARLAPGVTVAAADNELRAFAVRAHEADAANKDWAWRVQPLREALLSGADHALLFVQAGAAVLLVLAISNLASLLMAWSAERQRESAVRLALGAAGWQLVRQFLVQSVLLVSLGGALGVLLAWFALPALQRLNPNPALAGFLAQVELDRGTLGFAALLVLGAGLVAGLLPALQARNASLVEALRSESRGASLSRGALRAQQAMVVLQAAISVLILVGAALAGLGFWKLSRTQLGFATENRVVFRLQFPEPAYATHAQRAQFVRTLEQNLAQEPALLGFGLTTTLPVGDIAWGGGFCPELPNGEFAPDPIVFNYRRVSPRYLATMGIPLLEGRLIDERDRNDSPPVAVVSQALADKYWPGRSALGRKLRRLVPADSRPVEIVGVVGNVHDAGLGQATGETIYVPFEQVSLRRASVVLLGRGSREETLAAARHALRATSPGVAAYDIATLDELAWQANAVSRLQVFLLGVFAAIAIGITALGSYGVMSQLVANRQKEMAIRAALGATRAGVLRLVLWQNARLAALGVAAGLAIAWFGARALETQLAGFDASPAWPYLAVGAGVLMLTQLASLIPARRAARLDVQLVLASA